MGKEVAPQRRTLARARLEFAQEELHAVCLELAEADGEAEQRACSSDDLDAPALREVMGRAKAAAAKVTDAEREVLSAARKFARANAEVQ